jgi:PAS domain S-box-containing protein
MNVGERLSADPVCRRALDHLATLVRVWTPAEGVTYVNRAWRDLTGTTLEDNLGEGWLRAVHSDDRASVLVAFGTSRGAARAEYRLTTHDGQTVAVSDTPSSTPSPRKRWAAAVRSRCPSGRTSCAAP